MADWMGHDVTPRPLTVSVSRKVFDLCHGVEAEVRRELDKVEAERRKGGSYSPPEPVEPKMVEAIVSAAALLLDHYGLKDEAETARAGRVSVGQALYIVQTQVDVSMEDDLLLDPLKMLVLQLAFRKRKHQENRTTDAVVKAAEEAIAREAVGR